MTTTAIRKPRIITATITRLRRMARTLEKIFPSSRDEDGIIGALVEELKEIADELSHSDARETRPDPSRRRAGSASSGRETQEKRKPRKAAKR